MKLISLLLALTIFAAACGGGSNNGEDAGAESTSSTTATSTTSQPAKTPATTTAAAVTSTSTTAASTTTSTAATSTTVAPSDTGVFDIELGDCILADVAAEQSSVPTVPCDQPHASEVYSAFLVDDGEYPGIENVDVWAGEGCLARFEPTFRESYDISPYFIEFLYPTEDSWNDQNDREVLCLASGLDLLTGSIVPSHDADPILTAAIAAAIAAPDEDGDPSPFPVDEATCAAGWIVNDIGADRLTELGVTANNVAQVEDIDFSDSELELVVTALGDCADIARLVADTLVNDGTFIAADGDCFAAEFDEVVLERAFKVALADPDAEVATDEFLTEFIRVADVCDLAL